MYKKKSNKIPFPEIASGEGPWKVFEDTTQPRTSTLSHEMYVPTSDEICILCGSDHNKMIRRHELGHAKWSPKTIGKLKENESEKCVEICEEVRVNYNLSVMDVVIDDWTICPSKFLEHTESVLYNGSVFDMTAWMLMNMKPSNSNRYYYAKNDSLEDAAILQLMKELMSMQEDFPNHPNQMTKLRLQQMNFAYSQAVNLYRIISYTRGYGRKTSKYIKTRKAALILNKLMDEFNEKPEEHQVLESARKAKEAKEKALNANRKTMESKSPQEGEFDEMTLDELNNRNKEDIFSKANDNSNMHYVPEPNNMGKWGKMETFKPHLSVNLQSKIKGGREYRPMDYGVNPKYMNRWCVDKKVFKQKQRVYGGTILIDASGSMSFSGQDILEIMQLLPAVTIAMYNDRGGTWESGALRIIGRNGKRVSQDYLDRWTGGGNLVDGPALQWLSKQPQKRIWVSDMYVFGLHNTSSDNLLKDCIEICKRSGITRLADIDEVKHFALQLNQLV